jgi:hypothetical protein
VTATELTRAVDRLVDQVGHWTPSRWAASTSSGEGSRADRVHALAQRLADLEAAASGRPDRPVPRLDNDLALPDQVRVVALDLLAVPAPAETLNAALAAVAEARQDL